MMRQQKMPRENQDRKEYGEGPRKGKKPILILACKDCEQLFSSTDPKAKRCHKCRWRKLP